MKLEARTRLLQAGVINTLDRAPSTYMDEAEMDHALPHQQPTEEIGAKARLKSALSMDDADNAGNTGFVPTEENQDLNRKLDQQIADGDKGPGLGAAYRLLDTDPSGLFPREDI